MKNKLLVTGIALVMVMSLTACGKSAATTPDQTKEPNTSVETTTEPKVPPAPPKVDAETEKVIEYSIGVCEYSIPESWAEMGSTETIKRYYPEDGSLQISHNEEEVSITDDEVRKNFFEGFSTSWDKFELISESKITVAGTTAYRFDMKLEQADKKYKSSFVIFDYNNGMISLLMSIPDGSDKNYDKEFEKTLSSIRLTDETPIVDNAPGEDDGIISFQTDDFTIAYSHHEKGKDYKGNPCLYYYYTFTNKSSDNESAAFSANIKVFQNGVECTTALSLESRPEVENYLKEVQPGTSIEVCQVYELTDNSDVTIEAKELISFSDEKDTQIITFK